MAVLRKRGAKWYVIYNDHNGKQKWVKGFHDKRETEALAHRLEDEKTKLKRGDLDPQHEQRKVERAKDITAHVEEYKAALKAKGNSPNHVSYTIRDIELFIAFAKVTHAAAITRPMMDSWVLSLQEDGVDSRRTINRRVGSVQAFLRHLRDLGTLTHYVLDRYGKLKTHGHAKRKRRALSVDEQKLLVAKAPSDRADLYRFVLLTGGRFNQVQSLTVEKVNLAARTITFNAKDNRHRNREHIVPMHADLIPILKRVTKGKAKTDQVFDMPRREDAAKLVREDCKAAGVDSTDVDFHALRHSFITTLAQTKVHPKVLQALAGHADIETTLGYYVHFRRDDERAALDLLSV